MIENRKRNEVVKECAGAVIACWQHYADEPIDCVDGIEAALRQVLPAPLKRNNCNKI